MGEHHRYVPNCKLETFIKQVVKNLTYQRLPERTSYRKRTQEVGRVQCHRTQQKNVYKKESIYRTCELLTVHFELVVGI